MSKTPSREEALFADALARPAAERARFLAGACGGDRELLARLIGLIAAHEGPDSLLNGAPGQAAALQHEEKPGDVIGLSAIGSAKAGRYKLLQKLGEGGCGVVWMAEQVEPVRRRVALKVIKLGMDTKAVVVRFEAERQALAMMDHPNIAKVLDGGSTTNGRPFFVMELVRGIPVTRYCDENHLTPTERLDLFITICQAVQHAHQKGIIHRDLKPSNILVSAHDGASTPKIIDFGIAKATQGRLTNATLFTAFEMFIGTPAYMSPEQAEMTGVDVDARSDIYSLGVLLYELMTGQPPFDPRAFAQAGVDQIRQHIREIEPPTPSRRLHTLGEAERTTIARLRNTAPAHLSVLLRGDIDWIIMRCLEKNRMRRYETAHALALDIQRHLRHEPVVARPPSAGYRLQKFIRRHRVGFGATAMCAAALAAGVVLSRWQAGRAGGGLEPGHGNGSAFGTAAPAVGIPSIAVLAFKNLAGDAGTDYFSEGISEELRHVLAKVPNLRVTAPRSAFYFKGYDLPAAEIARQLGVTFIVRGSVRSAEDHARISVELINGSTGARVWSDGFERELKNIFAVQVDIAREIARQLELKLGDTPRAARTVNPAAHRLVLEGRHHWNIRNEEGFARAEVAFVKAKALDPQFAEAYAGLAEVCVIRANYREFDDVGETGADLKRAKEEARRAIELDPSLAEAHAALGFVAMLEARLAESESHFKRALALNPNSAVIHCWYALLLANRGKLDASLAAYARASALDPLWFINLHRQAWHLTRAGRFDEALRVNEHAGSLLKDVHIPNRADQALILLQLGLTAEAVDAVRLITQRLDKEPRWQADADAIWVLRQAGHEAEAAEHAQRVLARLPADSFNRGFVLGALGNFDEALPLLERAAVSPARGLFWDPMWDRWREDPRFRRLLSKLGRLEDYEVARATLARMTRPAESRRNAARK